MLSGVFWYSGTVAIAVSHIIKALIVPSVNTAGITALFYQYFEEDRSLAGITPYIFRIEEFSRIKKAAVVGCLVKIRRTLDISLPV